MMKVDQNVQLKSLPHSIRININFNYPSPSTAGQTRQQTHSLTLSRNKNPNSPFSGLYSIDSYPLSKCQRQTTQRKSPSSKHREPRSTRFQTKKHKYLMSPIESIQQNRKAKADIIVPKNKKNGYPIKNPVNAAIKGQSTNQPKSHLYHLDPQNYPKKGQHECKKVRGSLSSIFRVRPNPEQPTSKSGINPAQHKQLDYRRQYLDLVNNSNSNNKKSNWKSTEDSYDDDTSSLVTVQDFAEIQIQQYLQQLVHKPVLGRISSGASPHHRR